MPVVWACIEKGRRICGQQSVMVMEVPGKRRRGRPKWTISGTTCQKENCPGRKRARPGSMEASHKKHRSHTEAGKDVEEKDRMRVRTHTTSTVSRL